MFIEIGNRTWKVKSTTTKKSLIIVESAVLNA